MKTCLNIFAQGENALILLINNHLFYFLQPILYIYKMYFEKCYNTLFSCTGSQNKTGKIVSDINSIRFQPFPQ